MSRCAAIEEALLAFSHDLLEGKEQRKVADHLEGCAACRARSEVLRAELSILGEDRPAPAGLWSKIEAELDRAPAGFLAGEAGAPAGYLDGQAARASASIERARVLLERAGGVKSSAPRRRVAPRAPRRGVALAGVLVLILATTLGLALFQLPPEPEAPPAPERFRRGVFLAERAAIFELVEQGGPR